MTEQVPDVARVNGRPPLRVAVLARAVAPLHGIGGLERHTADLVRHLLDRGVALTLITRAPTDAAARPLLDHPNLSLRWVPYRSFPFAGRRGTTAIDRSTAYIVFGLRAGHVAASLAERREIDLVYGLGASALGYARVRHRDRTRTVPFVFNPQGLEEFGGADGRYGGARLKRVAYFPLQCAVRACARAADRVIATDRALEPVILQHLRIPRSRLRLVPNAVDLDRCDRLAGPEDGLRRRAEAGYDRGQAVLVSVGRLEQNKGYQVLVRALGALDAPDWRWVVIGDGPFRPRLERAIEEQGLRSKVLLTGQVDDRELHAWYEAATLFVHPTLYEGSSLVTLEAMAHGRAVVATAAGGLPDKVRPGVTGWLVEPNHAEALAGALREALRDRDRLRQMGLAARARVEHEFAWPAIVSQLLALYNEVLAEAGDARTAPL